MLNQEQIKGWAQELGFDCCGIVRADHLLESEARFRDWIGQGCHASLEYLERNIDKRFDARRLVEGARSIVICGVSYKSVVSGGYPLDHRAKIASYGCNADYHTSIKAMLQTLLQRLVESTPELRGRAFVDSAPLSEKSLAVEAGLGWIGRNSLLITPKYGSFIHLGELVLTEEFDCYDTPFEGERCGSCHACIDHCPTAAIGPHRTIDARRCIACHTIERKQECTVDLDGWIFGCDACQHHCPYNLRADIHKNSAFDPLFDPRELTPEQWLKEGNEGFIKRCSQTPMMRAGWERIAECLRKDSDCKHTEVAAK